VGGSRREEVEGTIMGMGVRNPFHPEALRLCDIRPYRSVLIRYTGDLGLPEYKAVVVGPITEERGIYKFPAVFLLREGSLRCYMVDAATIGVVPYVDGGWDHTRYVTAE